jgi:8-oxo-dGTP diphosphatase
MDGDMAVEALIQRDLIQREQVQGRDRVRCLAWEALLHACSTLRCSANYRDVWLRTPSILSVRSRGIGNVTGSRWKVSIKRASAIDVVCLVLQDKNGDMLAAQRPFEKRLGGCWEFPGGKVEPGEEPEAALRREILEELGFVFSEALPLEPVLQGYSFGSIRLYPFHAKCTLRPDIQLHEHIAVRWLSPDCWEQLTWAPADIPVILRLLGTGDL